MTDRDMTAESGGTSRRTMLKGAVGAGVGLAAWSAPKIGSVPAYALTSSTGLFNNVCYYFTYNVANGDWRRGATQYSPGLPGKDTGQSDSVVRTGTTSTYTWLDVFGTGNPLVVTIAGSPQGTNAIITLDNGGPDNCTFDQISGVTYSVQPANPPGMNGDSSSCLTTASSDSTGTTVSLGATAGTVQIPATPADTVYYVIFNIVCS